MANVRKRLWPKVLLVLVLLGCVGAGVFFAKQRAEKGADEQSRKDLPVSVGTAVVHRQDVTVSLTALGTISAPNAVNVVSRVDGVLQKLHFKEGQRVKAGDLLAEIDSKTYQAQLMQAQGQLMKDEALLSNARLDLNRYQQLWAQNSIAKQTVDTQASLVKQYEGTVKVDQANVELAKVQLSYTKIQAPVSGRLGLRNVSLGSLVKANDSTAIVTITQNQPIDVVFAVPETQLPKVLVPWGRGETLMVEAWDRDNRTLLDQGALLTVDNQINPETGTVSLKARFKNTKEWLFPNQFVNVKLRLGTLKQALVVPSSAIQQGNAGAYVYLVGPDSTVSVQAIEAGASEAGMTVVNKGLNEGDQVVADGLDKLREGSKVRPVNQEGRKPQQGKP
jgi:multidrug efflux system membrane fusion protein